MKALQKLALQTLLFGAVFFASCTSPTPDTSTVVVSGGQETAKLMRQIDSLNTTLDANKQAEAKRLSKIAASNEVIDESASRIPSSNEQKAVAAESDIISANTADVAVLPDDRADAQSRKAKYWQGQFDLANSEKDKAINQASDLRKELNQTRSDADTAVKLVQTQASAAKAENEEQKKVYEARLTSLKDIADSAIKEAKEAKDKARADNLLLLSRAFLGLGSALFLVAVGLLIATQGKEILRAAIAFGCSMLAFTAYWTMNQPWFLYVAIGVAVLFVGAVATFLYLTWKDLHEKRVLKVRSGEADEAEATLGRMLDVLDALPETDPIISKLTSALSDTHKALLNELRAERQRGLTTTTSTNAT